MGCGGLNGVTACSGYELTRDLGFAEADSYADSVVNQDWLPNCGDPLPGQDVRMTSGFLRFSNAKIGHPAFIDHDSDPETPERPDDLFFFYDIEDTAANIDITGIGVNGTTAGNYVIQDADGQTLTNPSVAVTQIQGLNHLNTGDEFYLSVTFTKGSDSFTQRYRFKK